MSQYISPAASEEIISSAAAKVAYKKNLPSYKNAKLIELNDDKSAHAPELHIMCNTFLI